MTVVMMLIVELFMWRNTPTMMIRHNSFYSNFFPNSVGKFPRDSWAVEIFYDSITSYLVVFLCLDF